MNIDGVTKEIITEFNNKVEKKYQLSEDGNTITWNITSLAPGQTTTITIQAKIILAVWEKNRTEVCDYEEAGELQDPDSDPCNMGPNGMPNEDCSSIGIKQITVM